MERIERIARRHGIQTRRDGGRLLLLSIYTEGGEATYYWEDATDWGRAELLVWLGY